MESMDNSDNRYSIINLLATACPSLISASVLAPLNRLKIIYQTQDLLFKRNISFDVKQLVISK
jgi:hypothetical protein